MHYYTDFLDLHKLGEWDELIHDEQAKQEWIDSESSDEMGSDESATDDDDEDDDSDEEMEENWTEPIAVVSLYNQ